MNNIMQNDLIKNMAANFFIHAIKLHIHNQQYVVYTNFLCGLFKYTLFINNVFRKECLNFTEEQGYTS